jgi:hypothetical protein
MVRDEVLQLQALGPLPIEKDTTQDDDVILDKYDHLLRAITRLVTDEEGRILMGLFGEDGDSCFGLKWSVLHLVETAPGWPLMDCLPDIENEWIQRLRISLKNAGQLD